MPRRRRHRRIQDEALQFDLFGPRDATRPAATPNWQQLPEVTRTTVTRLMARLLVEHASGDPRPRSIGGRDDV
jgi:hypothetical protein